MEPNISNVVQRSQVENPDLVLLDLDPLAEKGFNLIRELREEQTIPLLVLLSVRDVNLVLQVYKAGADDCIVKPIEPDIFQAKVVAWLNRCMAAPVEMLYPLRAGNVYLIPMERLASLDNGCLIHLTIMETRLLYVLMSRKGRTIPAEQLISLVWRGKEKVGVDILKTLIYRLRQKLEAEPANLHCLITVPGIGYKFAWSAEKGTEEDGGQDKLQVDQP